ncbi:MAG: hypothetical protein EP350_08745 [Alphaproteobacteria bacterium]|nr:MAG: hypothetical protein EP350_08745 [Alphaproteobacteria bacterium]
MIFWLLVTSCAIMPVLFIGDFPNGQFRTAFFFQMGSYYVCAIAVAAAVGRPSFNITWLMFLVYFLVFFLYPSMFHIQNNLFPVFKMSYNGHSVQGAAILLFAFLATTYASHMYFGRNRPIVVKVPRQNQVPENVAFLGCVGFAIAAWALLAFALTELELREFLQYRNQFDRVVDRLGPNTAGVYITLPRITAFLSLTCAVLYGMRGKSKSAFAILVAINLPVFLILNFPLALPRFYIFGYLVFWFFLFADLRNRVIKNAVAGGFIFGACFVMPVFDAINRRGKTVDDLAIADALRNYVRGGDFDGFQSFINATIYVEGTGINLGQQLISAIFFFVPRAFWEGKSEHTGVITAQAAGYRDLNFNVSAPLPAELYVDFGLVGLIGGAILLGWAIQRIDERLTTSWAASLKGKCTAAMIGGFSIIFLRGALLAVGPMLFTLAAGLIALRLFVLKDGQSGQARYRSRARAA